MERFHKIGEIVAKSSHEVKFSRLGIGFEKLDRDVFDPEKAYPHLEKIGVKWARLQSGWLRTEKEKGVYDFSWLDPIVDKIISLEIEPWLCLCYGNPLYTEKAKDYFGAVGIAPVDTEEEMQAWLAYVKATVEHYKGKIRYFEIWNEPDGKSCWKHEKDTALWARFSNRTAKAIKEANPDALAVGPALAKYKDFAVSFAENGGFDGLDVLSYHGYSVYEEVWKDRFQVFDDLRRKVGRPEMEIVQGEGGTQSRSDGSGALHGGAWTQRKQIKYLLRHLILDLAMGVKFTSYFSCMDMIEALNGRTGNVATYLDYGYFGVVGAEFDENGRSVGTYAPKPSYRTLQTLCAVMAEEWERIPFPAKAEIMPSIRLIGEDFDFAETEHHAFRRANGATALFYWVPRNLLTETYEGTVSLRLDPELRDMPLQLVDMADGSVFDIPEEMRGEDGLLINLPVTDSPLMLMFGDFAEWKRG